MSDPKAVILEYWDRMSRGQVDDAFDLVADDVDWWVLGVGSFESKQRFREANQWFLSQLVDEHVEFTPGILVEEDGTVGMTMESRAVVAANGKAYANEYALLIHVRDGKIAWAREYPNTAHVADVLSDLEAV